MLFLQLLGLASIVFGVVGVAFIVRDIHESNKLGFTKQEYFFFMEYKRYLCEKYNISMREIDDIKVYKRFLELIEEV